MLDVGDRLRLLEVVERGLVDGLEPEGDDERPVTPLELFFDLVFVFALTQVTALMAERVVANRAGDGGGASSEPTAIGALARSVVFIGRASGGGVKSVSKPDILQTAKLLLK